MDIFNMENYSLTAVLLALFTLLTITAWTINKVAVYLARRRFKLENGCEPLTAYFPMWDKLFGIDNMLQTLQASREGRLLKRAVNNFNKLGNTFGAHLFGQKIIATIEPENIKAILSLKFKDFSLGNRNDTLGPLLGTGIFNSDGEAWAHSRAMIRPNFTRDQVADLEAFERHIQHLFAAIPRDGSTVDLQELFFRFTIDSATEFLFGKSVNSLQTSKTGGPDESAFAVAFNRAQHAVAMRARTGFLKNFIRDKKGTESIRVVHEYVDQFVDEAVRYREAHDDLEKKGGPLPAEKYVFLHELAKATKDKRRLRDELLNVLLAGRDTTASLLSNMWFMLAQRPEIYEKLRREVEETLHGDMPTYGQLRNMKYLKYCMNECKLPVLTPLFYTPSLETKAESRY
jgi:cytochrome P450